jgi:hypothetical protein
MESECENVVAERHNLNLQVHAVDDPLKRKSSVGNLLEGARRNNGLSLVHDLSTGRQQGSKSASRRCHTTSSA